MCTDYCAAKRLAEAYATRAFAALGVAIGGDLWLAKARATAQGSGKDLGGIQVAHRSQKGGAWVGALGPALDLLLCITTPTYNAPTPPHTQSSNNHLLHAHPRTLLHIRLNVHGHSLFHSLHRPRTSNFSFTLFL